MVYYSAHPAWRDIYLQAKESYGDEIILLGIHYHIHDFLNATFNRLRKRGWVKQVLTKSQIMDIITDEDRLSDLETMQFSDLKRIPLTLTLPDMLTPTMEISYYDYCFFISFWKVLYDNSDYFGNREFYDEVRSQVSGIAESVFDQQYGLYFNTHHTPYINESMAYHLLQAFIGFKVDYFIVEDRYSWLEFQWIKSKDWPQKETAQEWFSPMWGPLKRKAPFMNWDESPL